MTTHTTPESPPSSDFDVEHNCPRGKFSVELLNALHTRFNGWREVLAVKDNIDFYGHPIKVGERHFFRSTGPSVSSCERLTALSMDRLLWLTFGENLGLVEFCKEMLAQQKAEDAREAVKCAAKEATGSTGGGE